MYPAVVNELCFLRSSVFNDVVIQGGLGMDEVYCKAEFGSHNGRWHNHSLAMGAACAELLQGLLDRVVTGGFSGARDSAAWGGWDIRDLVDLELRAAADADTVMRRAFGDIVSAVHPAGRTRTGAYKHGTRWNGSVDRAVKHVDVCSARAVPAVWTPMVPTR
jgi:hypothetical protein